ncbi:hypothetical protein SMACR_04648 [Sordaria macrospora]|uniref:WGS project CABT00000000 data, contig 2.20 n=2 Tax=Sordaria macrospora TaxID=5147 RepID=F7W1N4_SORMK|nr:uncharacterized protein SMAC_04648 [Sordaria macrospora k-hell]KAA8627977.1 hypothetical protein SMACR_04648 [Sordaria macrospora]WPJ58452.1 hypothetical protein SMAC4_04648 [Sordaria macrospora]CCC11666.1 unnamed protein product [Sordaria macrospora k-hell]
MAPGSRRSVRSSTPIPMPVIAEDEQHSDPARAAAAQGATTTPTVPPRSPHRRSSTTRSSSSLYPGAPSGSGSGSGSARPALSRSSSVPQYVPKPKRAPGIRAVGGEVDSVRSIPLNSDGSERWVIPTVRDREGKMIETNDGGLVRPVKGIGKSEDGRAVGHGGGKEKDKRGLGGWVRSPGRWYKVVVLGILIIGLIVGLAVGLTVRLRKRHNSSDPEPPLPTDLFPAGSYTFTAALANLSASCAPQRNPSLWRCYPYALYSPTTDESTSAASFRWIIRPTTTYSYVISSSDDPFSPTGTFKDVNLTMIDANQPSERFTFSFVMAKAVVPDVTTASNSSSSMSSAVSPTTTMTIAALSSSSASASTSQATSNGGEKARRRWLRSVKREDNNTISREAPTTTTTTTTTTTPAEPAICWYNQTVVRGTIWTRMSASYPANITDVPTPLINATNVFAPWPFAVELTLEQTYEEDGRGNGKKAPDCRDAAGNPVVFRNNDNMKVAAAAVRARDMSVVDEADICRCSYTNYGLDTIASSNSSSAGNPQGQSQDQGLG